MIDPEVRKAILRAVKKHQQSEHVAEKIIKWLEALSEANERLDDKDAVERRLEFLYSSVDVDVKDNSQEG